MRLFIIILPAGQLVLEIQLVLCGQVLFVNGWLTHGEQFLGKARQENLPADVCATD